MGAREYRNDNPEKIKQLSRERYVKNKEKINEKGKIYWKEKYQNNPVFRLEMNLRRNFRQRINKNGNKFVDFLSIPISEYLDYLSRDPLWEEYRAKKLDIHIDHIIPCSLYNFNDLQEIKKCWNPKNLRLLIAYENVSKGNKLDMALVEQYAIHDLLPKEIKMNYENNLDPYAWGTIKPLESLLKKQIRDEKEEFKREELKNEEIPDNKR